MNKKIYFSSKFISLFEPKFKFMSKKIIREEAKSYEEILEAVFLIQKEKLN